MSDVISLTSFSSELIRSFTSEKPIQIVGASSAFCQMALSAYLSQKSQDMAESRNVLVLLPHAKQFDAWLGYCQFSLPTLLDGQESIKTSLLPHYAGWGHDRFINPTLTRRQRLAALHALTNADEGRQLILATVNGLMQQTIDADTLRHRSLTLRVDQDFDQDDLIEYLENLNYRLSKQVDEEGAFAVRGAIVDIFSPQYEHPLRIEFSDEGIASIRRFSIVSQRSMESTVTCIISPNLEADLSQSKRAEQAQRLFARMLDLGVNQEDRDGVNAAFLAGQYFQGLDVLLPAVRKSSVSALSYLSSDFVIAVPGSIEKLLESYQEFFDRACEAAEKDLKQGRATLPVLDHYAEPDEVRRQLSAYSRLIEFENPFSDKSRSFYRIQSRPSLPMAPVMPSSGTQGFDQWVDIVKMHLKAEHGVVFLAHQPEQVERIGNLLEHRGLSFHNKKTTLRKLVQGKLRPGQIYLGIGEVSNQVWLDDIQILVIPESAVFGASRKRSVSAPAKLKNYLNSFKDLSVGDLVVHVQHGIGRYLGMKSLEVAAQKSDFIWLEYAGGDKVYLPVDKLNLLQRYSSGEGHSPSLDKLKGQGWSQRKSKVHKAIRDMADELVKLQAQRQIVGGYAFSAPSDDYLAFEGEFLYEETEDQLRSIQDVISDMSEKRPMDRLICGDVGFGKTEVALRAAYRAVLDHHQVMVLVPTTVLCYQHYRTFQERMQHHGVRVAQVNRFVTAAEIKKSIADFEKGHVDVLVGTHRMLSKDVKPRRLGLLIVDEEQKFGVTHKERLKHFRAGCDVLTLTATPIPRTLHMAMVGLRDISIIATAPTNRVSVKTYVSRFDETLIRDAIEYEVARGGQVFFIHNRVEDIAEIAAFVKALVPRVSVQIGHGQMAEHKLEQTIVDFMEGKFQVLVCTTIIEAGVDMPNVNTLIVNRADRFGLSQLYQLRGRVGRSDRQAYAYFLSPPEESLSADAQKRLDVLSAHQELGAGFQIASHDLEIRGAGNLLGGEQSGRVADVGIELYTEMLEAAIRESKGGEGYSEKVDVELKIPVSAVLTGSYISEESQRLQAYKSLFSAETEKELIELRADFEDRFGSMPPEVKVLFRIADLKRMLRVCGVNQLMSKGGYSFDLRFGSLKEQQIDKILKVASSRPERYRLSPDYRLRVAMQKKIRTANHAEHAEDWLIEMVSLVQPLYQEMSS